MDKLDLRVKAKPDTAEKSQNTGAQEPWFRSVSKEGR
jgi:hypothetical protein